MGFIYIVKIRISIPKIYSVKVIQDSQKKTGKPPKEYNPLEAL
jgi:hypothetical protein